MKTCRRLKGLPLDATYAEASSPVGKLTIITSPLGLHAIIWEQESADAYNQNIIAQLKYSKTEKTIVCTRNQLGEYFSGKRTRFDLSLVLNGTSFQKQAWQELCKIPYGQTISYGEQAAKIGNKNKCRAIGMANGSNPISIVIPCHRVIGSKGSLTGFAGGLDRKQWLLEHERRNIK